MAEPLTDDQLAELDWACDGPVAFIVAAVAVHSMIDEIRQSREALRNIRDTCRCTCGEVGNRCCPHCDAVAAIGKKENTDG